MAARFPVNLLMSSSRLEKSEPMRWHCWWKEEERESRGFGGPSEGFADSILRALRQGNTTSRKKLKILRMSLLPVTAESSALFGNHHDWGYQSPSAVWFGLQVRFNSRPNGLGSIGAQISLSTH